MHNGNFDVVGMEEDGTLICRPEGTTGDSDYNCGETLEQYGVDNLSEEERTAIGEESLIEATGKKFVSVDGVVFEDFCVDCGNNLWDCVCEEEE